MSTLGDQVGACVAALKPIHSLIEAHVLAAERLHGDDTTASIDTSIQSAVEAGLGVAVLLDAGTQRDRMKVLGIADGKPPEQR